MEIKIGTPSQYSKKRLISDSPPNFLAKGSYFVSLYRNTELIGSLQIKKQESTYVIRKVEIKESERGKGQGKQLMEHTLQFLKSKGLPVLLQVDPNNKPAVTLQKKLGFQKIKSNTQFGDKYQYVI